jgi:hypothetical protein
MFLMRDSLWFPAGREHENKGGKVAHVKQAPGRSIRSMKGNQ